VTGQLRDRAIGGNDHLSATGTAEGGQAINLFGDAGADILDHARAGNDVMSGSLPGPPAQGPLNAYGDTAADIRDYAHGGDDMITGAGFGRVSLFGDAGGNLYGHAAGGNDSLSATFATGGIRVAGDAGGDMFDDTRGGNDIIDNEGAILSSGNLSWGDAVGEMHDRAHGGNDVIFTSSPGRFGGATAYGDATSMSGHAIGGDDDLTSFGAPVGIGAGPGVTLFGDARIISDHARGGDDRLTGGTSFLGNGTNMLVGDAETMSDHARGGNDVLVSGHENDVMYGDAVNLAPTAHGGRDTFVFGPDNGQDTIGDFRHGEDKIDLRPLGIAAFASLDIEKSGADSIIHLGGENQIIIANDTHLVASDFIFSRTSVARTTLVTGDGNAGSFDPVLSGDGTKLAFQSDATNLVAGTSGVGDIFLRDLVSGELMLVTAGADNRSVEPALSADGSKLAFGSFATNLAEGDTNGSREDVFLKGLQTGETSLITAGANNDSENPAISADGARVAFWSFASNLVDGDTNGTADIFVKDQKTGDLTLITPGANSLSLEPSISADGTKVAFWSLASNLVPDDTNDDFDVFLKDLQTGQLTLLTPGANGPSVHAVISGDGTKVAFQSVASNLVPGDTNGAADIFIKNLVTGELTLVTSGSNADSDLPALSADGMTVAFQSFASNLAEGDTNNTADIFVKDLWTGELTLITAGANGASTTPTLSADGKTVAFSSFASNLVPGDENDASDIFVSTVTSERLAHKHDCGGVHSADWLFG
jgi:Tol biopolymer transport system component